MRFRCKKSQELVEIYDESKEIMDAKNDFFKVICCEIGKVMGSISNLDEIEMKLGKEFGRKGM